MIVRYSFSNIWDGLWVWAVVVVDNVRETLDFCLNGVIVAACHLFCGIQNYVDRTSMLGKRLGNLDVGRMK